MMVDLHVDNKRHQIPFVVILRFMNDADHFLFTRSPSYAEM